MSGTSLDGIDIVECNFEFNNRWRYSIIRAATIPYTKYWLEKLRTCSELGYESLVELDRSYTQFLADQILSFINGYNIASVDYICSHGHTAQHRPELGYTYQMGNMPQLSSHTGNSVVCDFRKQDVEFGGQGAPLVPIGDHLLFADYDYCLNLGGFSNVSFIEDGERVHLKNLFFGTKANVNLKVCRPINILNRCGNSLWILQQVN